MNNKKLKFSIITPSFNHGRFIRDAIESVLMQNYEHFEHIIIDGGSTDETIDILKSYKHLKWISEKDNGAADAIFKGFNIASGEIFYWVNSDDYLDENTLNIVSEFFSSNKNAELLFGNLTIVDKDKNLILKDKTPFYDLDFILNYSAHIIRQPATFFTRRLYEEAGGIDIGLKLVFDLDLFIRMIRLTKPVYINTNFAYFRQFEETLTNTNLKKQAYEIFKVSRKYGGRLFSRQNMRNIRQYILNKQ